MQGGGRPALRYRPGLDGVRAIAVAGVLLYHGQIKLFRGGFVGVDVFFVLSGFLITSLLLHEGAVSHTIRLGRFWLARARRLLPAALLVVIVSVVVIALFFRSDLRQLRGDALASVFYFNNWHQILAHRSYFEHFARPSLLQHFWSLSVEEQFYLVWPPVLLLLLRWRVRRGQIALGALVLALTSAVLMAVLFNGTVDHTRIYFGTDTHATPILLGVALACCWPTMQEVARIRPPAQRTLDLVGAAGVVLVLVTMTAWPDYSPFVYRGGLVIAALGAALLIASASHPGTRTGRVLGSAPLVWIGKRSYGVYLWHWPIMALTRPNLDVQMPLVVLVALQAALTVVLAAASYRYLEMPIRRGELQARLRAWRQRASPRGRLALGAGVPVAIGGFVAVIALLPTAAAPAPAGASATLAAQQAPAAIAPAAPARQASGRPQGPILMVGASVMLQAKDQLQSLLHPRLDAVDSRQPDVILQRLQGYRDSHALPPTVVVQTGENSPLEAGYLNKLRAVLSGVPHVIIMTLRYEGAGWIDDTNAQLVQFVSTWPTATLADWNSASSDPSLLWDGAHPDPKGQEVYAQVVKHAIQVSWSKPPPPV
ncbi:MAG TPA: acyltransferase family protein [Solirubrobacteraceae bacterium]|nr:acyltransferase family protein [Solirubrobacteraceae bacterium]